MTAHGAAYYIYRPLRRYLLPPLLLLLPPLLVMTSTTSVETFMYSKLVSKVLRPLANMEGEKSTLGRRPLAQDEAPMMMGSQQSHEKTIRLSRFDKSGQGRCFGGCTACSSYGSKINRGYHYSTALVSQAVLCPKLRAKEEIRITFHKKTSVPQHIPYVVDIRNKQSRTRVHATQTESAIPLIRGDRVLSKET